MGTTCRIKYAIFDGETRLTKWRGQKDRVISLGHKLQEQTGKSLRIVGERFKKGKA